MYRIPVLFLLILGICSQSFAQSCTPLGDQTSYGTGNVWIGYVYNNSDLTSYRGYVNEGTASSANFDESFGGDNVTYATNGCGVQTETFSVRYKLNKNFTAGTYQITVGGDDGYRLSVDGGATWLINNWALHAYTTTQVLTTLSGSTNLVLEFYENSGSNRVSFAVSAVCTGSENTTISGTGNIWNGYIYDGTAFNIYSGMVHEGTAASAAFDESFGGNTVTYNTSSCGVYTETFSARYRLRKTFANGTYQFTVGGDDGYRLSIDGGATWLINKWFDQSYAVTYATTTLNGTYDMVLEYYENGGGNRLSFNVQTNILLPITLGNFEGRLINDKVQLSWTISASSTPRNFTVERAGENGIYSAIGTVPPNGLQAYAFEDSHPLKGRSAYRLKMTDENGKISYSDKIYINFGASSADWKLYPTVVTNGRFQLSTNAYVGSAQLTIIDLQGRVVLRKQLSALSAGTVQSIDASSFARRKGVYAVLIQEGAETRQAKLVIQ